MTYVLATVVIALALEQLRMSRANDRDRRAHARERDLLINQLMHLAGRTWTPPPADQPHEPEPDDEPLYVDPAHLTTWE